MSQPPGFKSLRGNKKELILKFLRKEESKELSHQQLAERFGVNKTLISIYKKLIAQERLEAENQQPCLASQHRQQ